MRKVDYRGNGNKINWEERGEILMIEILATNVGDSQPYEQQPTAMPTIRAKLIYCS